MVAVSPKDGIAKIVQYAVQRRNSVRVTLMAIVLSGFVSIGLFILFIGLVDIGVSICLSYGIFICTRDI